jgi:hypothetical protein
MLGDQAWPGKLHGELCALIAPVFAQARSRFAAFAYVAELLATAGDRKSCWQLAEQAGHDTPQRMQALLAEYARDWRAALTTPAHTPRTAPRLHPEEPASHQREQVIQPRDPRSKIIISQHATGMLPQLSQSAAGLLISGSLVPFPR